MTPIEIYHAYLIASPVVLLAGLFAGMALSIPSLARCSAIVGLKLAAVQLGFWYIYPNGIDGPQPYLLYFTTWSIAAIAVAIPPADKEAGYLGFAMVPLIIGAFLSLALEFTPQRDWNFWINLMTCAVAELVIIAGWTLNETGKYILARYNGSHPYNRHSSPNAGD